MVTRPFGFEGKKRAESPARGIRQLSQYVDSLITIPNEKLIAVYGRDAASWTPSSAPTTCCLGAVQGIDDLSTPAGLHQTSIRRVQHRQSEMGMAMGTGTGTGQDRARGAAESANRKPLLEEVHLAAQGILVNITAATTSGWAEFERGRQHHQGLLVRETPLWWWGRCSIQPWATRCA